MSTESTATPDNERLTGAVAELRYENQIHVATSAAEKDMLLQMMQQIQRQLETCHAELRITQANLREQRQSHSATHEKLIEYMVENEKVQAEKNRVTQKLAELEAWVNAIKTSPIYRLTYPVRRLRAALRRQR
ncbi:hypothetical protein LZG00_12700 [Rhodobacteraceae bacterium LMO-12]|nr:hypothetical protein [Rhodobacteraceae bacterium LMO-JJ12]